MSGHSGKTAVISGGSSGIGLECARILCTRGYHVTLLARDEARLENARHFLKEATGLDVAIRRLDVVDAADCEAAIAEVIERNGGVDWLITCAGMVEPGLFHDLSPESHRQQMETNYFGTLNLVTPVARHMMRRGGGRITMVSSAAAFVGIAGYSAYAPSKFAVRALGDVLRVELEPHGVCVSVAFPPDTDTPQLAEDAAKRPHVTRLIAAGGGVMSASSVAESIIKGAEAGRFMLTPSALTSLFGWAHSLYAPFFRSKQIGLMRRVRK